MSFAREDHGFCELCLKISIDGQFYMAGSPCQFLTVLTSLQRKDRPSRPSQRHVSDIVNSLTINFRRKQAYPLSFVPSDEPAKSAGDEDRLEILGR